MERQLKEAYQYYVQQKEKAERSSASSRQHLLVLQVPDNEGWHPIDITEPTTFYKVVASAKEELVSVHDGASRFSIGRWTLGKHGANGWPPLSACFFAYQLAGQALSEKFPRESKHRASPKALIEVVTSGRAYFNPQTCTWALSRLRPVRILPDIIRDAGGGPDGPAALPSPERALPAANLEAKPSPWVP